jgi:hypothetical protein
VGATLLYGVEGADDLPLKPLIACDDSFPFGKPARACKHFEPDHRRIERYYTRVAQLVMKPVCETGSGDFRQDG